MIKTLNILVCLFIVTFIFISCGKDEQRNWGEWNIEGFNSKADKRGGVLLSNDTVALFAASAGRNDGIAFYFNTKPTFNQTFEVVDFTTTPAANLGPNQCYILINVPTNPPSAYWSTDDPNNLLEVTVQNGKVRADFSNIKFRVLRNTNVIEAIGSGFVQEK